MNLAEKKEVIGKVSLFKGFSDEQLNFVAEATVELKYSAGEVITEQEDQPGSAYIICSGFTKVYRLSEDGLEINLAILGPGEIVGELSLLDGQPRSATVETIEDSSLLRLIQADFMKILLQQPSTAINLLKNLASRLRATNENLESVMSKNLVDRTWKTLQTLSSYFANSEIKLSQEQLAAIIGATRARVTEALNELQTQGKITLAQRKIKLL